ncbi:hypothetical protein I4100191B2_00430 [Clostridiales bacterium]
MSLGRGTDLLLAAGAPATRAKRVKLPAEPAISEGAIHLPRGYKKRDPMGACPPWEKQQIIYKHAISTIVPERPVPLCDPGELE